MDWTCGSAGWIGFLCCLGGKGGEGGDVKEGFVEAWGDGRGGGGGWIGGILGSG